MREKIELTWQKGRGLWKKCVGKRLGTDGKTTPMIWWFTDHRAESEELCELVLYGLQEFVVKAGLSYWTPEAIAKVQAGLKRAKKHFARAAFHSAASTEFIANFHLSRRDRCPGAREPGGHELHHARRRIIA